MVGSITIVFGYFDGFDLDGSAFNLEGGAPSAFKDFEDCHCLPSVNCWYASPGESSPSLVLVP